MCKYRSFFWDCDPEGTNFAIHQPIQNQVLTFFRVNAVYQFISLAVLLILIRLPFLFTPLPLLIPELNWMLVGEQMSNGFLMYRDIWDNTSPLSAVVYWLVTSVFGRSQVAFQLVAMFFSITQAVYFNYMTNTRQLFTERNYVPGLMYVLFLNLSFDLCTLTPMLMSTTFLLLALGTLIKQMERQGVTDEIFEIGFYLGVATLFYLPSAIFIIWAAVSLIFFTGATFRQHSLMLLGFAFPILVTGLFFYFSGGLSDLNRNLLERDLPTAALRRKSSAFPSEPASPTGTPIPSPTDSSSNSHRLTPTATLQPSREMSIWSFTANVINKAEKPTKIASPFSFLRKPPNSFESRTPLQARITSASPSKSLTPIETSPSANMEF